MVNNILHVLAPGGGVPIDLIGKLVMDGSAPGVEPVVPQLIIIGVITGEGEISFPIPDNRVGNGGNAYTQCKGSLVTNTRCETNTVNNAPLIQDIPVQLQASFPNVPTRSQVCSMQLTFQGLPIVIPTGQYAGNYTCWFEPGLQCLSELSNRQVVYAAKKQAQDTHQILEFFTTKQFIYNEPGNEFQSFVTQVGEFDQAGFLALVIEVIQNGFTPVVVYDGDDGDNPMGYPNALRQLPILDALFKNTPYGDIRSYILFARFWDGVFYGSSPANIQAFGQAFRAINPNGYLAIEFNSGHIPVGNGENDYTPPNGMMIDYDTICAEFDNWPETGGPTWEVCARMQQTYIRPPDQSQGDDPNPPYYLVSGNERGPYFFIRFEWGEYPGTHSQPPPQYYIDGRNYYKALGPGIVC